MAEPPSLLDPQAVFQSTLLDASGQPNLIIDSTQPQELIWTLVNNATGSGQDLVVTPFTSGSVGPDQYHFLFGFALGALTDPPTLPGWAVAVQQDNRGGIKSLYIALSGNAPLTIPPSSGHQTTLSYTNAIQEDSNRSRVAVTVTAGRQVTLGGLSIAGKSYGPFDLTLVQAPTPALSVPPLAVDFVGRRTVLNDGQTLNCFTFALTNMTQDALSLTPKVGNAQASHTIFTVWFDAAPNQPAQPYPWALAKVEDLDSQDVVLTLPSSDWTYTKAIAKAEVTAGNPQWSITVSKVVALGPQEPVFFKFTGIKTDLDPGVTRMYLRYESLAGFHDGILIGELEKTPLLYGINRGQGLYVSAGKPQGNTPPIVNYDSGLYVNQFGDAPAATFNGGASTATDTVVQLTNDSAGGKTWKIISSGATNSAGAGKLLVQDSSDPVVTFQSDGKVGIGTPSPGFKLHIEGPATDANGGSVYLGGTDTPGTTTALRLGVDKAYGWVQSHGGEVPLALNPLGSNVGIGNTDPKNKLHVGSGNSTITKDRVNVIVASKATDAGIAIAQEGGPIGSVNLLLQASGAGAYIGTTSAHSLVFRTTDADRVIIDKDGTLTANNGARIPGPLSVSGPVSMFGSYMGRNIGTTYTAQTDGFVLATVGPATSPSGKSIVYLLGHVNGNLVARALGGNVAFMVVNSSSDWRAGSANNDATMIFPVPKGASWVVIFRLFIPNTPAGAPEVLPDVRHQLVAELLHLLGDECTCLPWVALLCFPGEPAERVRRPG
jgi:hypothetical protein